MIEWRSRVERQRGEPKGAAREHGGAVREQGRAEGSNEGAAREQMDEAGLSARARSVTLSLKITMYIIHTPELGI